MSLMCPLDDDCKQDTFVNILRRLFGEDYINYFIGSSDTPGVSDTALASALQLAASIAIIATIFIFFSFLIRSVVDSAGDGEALGLTERGAALGLVGRPLLAIVALAITPSGYPVFMSLIMQITLVSNGVNNRWYMDIMGDRLEMSVPKIEVTEDEAFKSSGDLTAAVKAGAMQAYCVKALNAQVSGANVGADLNVDGNFLQYAGLSKGVKVDISYSDGGRSIGDAFALCGGYSVTWKKPEAFRNQPLWKINGSSTDVSTAITALVNNNADFLSKINGIRGVYAAEAHMNGFKMAYGNGWSDVYGSAKNAKNYIDIDAPQYNPSPLSGLSLNTGPSGWDIQTNSTSVDATMPSYKDIGKISDFMNKDMNAKLISFVNSRDTSSSASPEIAEAIKQYFAAHGWLGAIKAQSTTRRMLNTAKSGLYSSPYETFFSVGVDESTHPETDSIIEASEAIMAVANAIDTGVSQNSNVNLGDLNLTMGAKDFISEIKQRRNPFVQITDALSYRVYSWLSEAEYNQLKTMVASDDSDVDALYQLQNYGENITLAMNRTSTIINTVKNTTSMFVAGVEVIGGAAQGVNPLGGAGRGAKMLNERLNESLDPLVSQIGNIEAVARYLTVILPTMPFVFFALGAISLIIQLIQLAFGLCLWFVMHSIPQRGFIGSQTQGYVTVFLYFFRITFLLAGLIISFEVFDVVLPLFVGMFIAIKEVTTAQTASNGLTALLLYIDTFFWSLVLFATTMTIVCYLIFGLVQELGDKVGNWIGTNFLSNFGNVNSEAVAARISSGMTGATMMAARGAGGRGNKGDKGDEDKKDKDTGGNPNGGGPAGGAGLVDSQEPSPNNVRPGSLDEVMKQKDIAASETKLKESIDKGEVNKNSEHNPSDDVRNTDPNTESETLSNSDSGGDTGSTPGIDNNGVGEIEGASFDEAKPEILTEDSAGIYGGGSEEISNLDDIGNSSVDNTAGLNTDSFNKANSLLQSARSGGIPNDYSTNGKLNEQSFAHKDEYGNVKATESRVSDDQGNVASVFSNPQTGAEIGMATKVNNPDGTTTLNVGTPATGEYQKETLSAEGSTLSSTSKTLNPNGTYTESTTDSSSGSTSTESYASDGETSLGGYTVTPQEGGNFDTAYHDSDGTPVGITRSEISLKEDGSRVESVYDEDGILLSTNTITPAQPITNDDGEVVGNSTTTTSSTTSAYKDSPIQSASIPGSPSNQTITEAEMADGSTWTETQNSDGSNTARLDKDSQGMLSSASSSATRPDGSVASSKVDFSKGTSVQSLSSSSGQPITRTTSSFSPTTGVLDTRTEGYTDNGSSHTLSTSTTVAGDNGSLKTNQTNYDLAGNVTSKTQLTLDSATSQGVVVGSPSPNSQLGIDSGMKPLSSEQSGVVVTPSPTSTGSPGLSSDSTSYSKDSPEVGRHQSLAGTQNNPAPIGNYNEPPSSNSSSNATMLGGGVVTNQQPDNKVTEIVSQPRNLEGSPTSHTVVETTPTSTDGYTPGVQSQARRQDSSFSKDSISSEGVGSSSGNSANGSGSLDNQAPSNPEKRSTDNKEDDKAPKITPDRDLGLDED